MSGPSERIGRTPSSTASSTISTARSTPKQNPNSSASKTSMLLGRLRRPFTLLAPFVSQLVAARDAIVDPLHLPLQGGGELDEHGLLEARERMCEIFGQNGVRAIADLAQTV